MYIGIPAGTTHNSISNKSIVHPKYCPKKDTCISYIPFPAWDTSISSLKHKIMQADGLV